ncbi:MAG: hypothetical protein LN364_03690 [Candidatus Thermoplasmatota archaeon]|nr:hypothetical protein [Candidatus Thermoplasmatota archaeon]
MEPLKNSVLLRSVITAIYNVASRRTSSKSADESIGSTIKTLEKKYDFLRHVNIDQKDLSTGDFAISFSEDIDELHPAIVGRALEALIRVVYNDIGSEAGLYFVTELKQLAGDDVSRAFTDCEIDLDQVQLEQHYAYNRQERKRAIADVTRRGKRPENLVGYDWGTVSHWKHEPGSKFCTLYDKQGNVLDRLNLDRIIQNYVERLSGYIDVDPREVEKQTSVYEKEYELLKLLLEKDMDADTALHMLHISQEELNNIIRKLSQMEMLQYASHDTIELTDIGVGYISKKEKTKK